MNTITSRILRSVVVLIFVTTLVACGRSGDSGDAATSGAKVPVTTSSAEARELYMQGRALFDDLRFVDAHELFLQAVDADDNFAMGHFMVASTALSNAEFFEEVARANALAANATEGEQLYIKALFAASESDQAGQQAALEQLVALYPDDERTHMQLSNYFFGQQNFTAANVHLNHAIAINPDFAPAYNQLGYSLRSLEDFDGARAAFAKYVELIPNEANPYDSLAELLMEMGEYDESIANYRKALAINRNFAASYAGISINRSLMGDPQRALEAADDMLAAARNFPERQAAMYSSAGAHLFAGNVEAAMKVCNVIMGEAVVARNDSAMATAAEFMGDIMLASGNAAKAEEYYDAALDHRITANLSAANKDQAARTHLFKTAIAAMMSGDSEAAAARTAEYTAAAEAHGTSFEKLRIHELAAYLAMNQEDNEAAAMHFAKASQLQPIPLYWAAWVNKELGNLDKARELAERAANRNTLNPNLPFFRANAVEMLQELSGG